MMKRITRFWPLALALAFAIAFIAFGVIDSHAGSNQWREAVAEAHAEVQLMPGPVSAATEHALAVSLYNVAIGRTP
jgi:hypothetical protein